MNKTTTILCYTISSIFWFYCVFSTIYFITISTSSFLQDSLWFFIGISFTYVILIVSTLILPIFLVCEITKDNTKDEEA